MIFSEAIGTFLIVFTIGCSGGDPFAVGGIIWCTMIFTRFVSGAIFNPAVTLSLVVKKLLDKSLKTLDLKLYFIYTVVQFISGAAGGYLAWKISNFTFFYDFANNYQSYKVFICEAIYTCILCLNVHMIGKSSYGLYVETFIIVITVVTGAKTIGHLSKNCLNPCVGVTMDFIYYLEHGRHFNNVWVYVAGPMTGGVTAAFISQFNKNLRENHQEHFNRSSLIFSPTQQKELISIVNNDFRYIYKGIYILEFI